MTIFKYMPRTAPRRTVEIHGFALREIREGRGRKVADLAAKLECDRSYITHIENGTKTKVSAEFYNALLAELVVIDYRALLANPHVAATDRVPA